MSRKVMTGNEGVQDTDRSLVYNLVFKSTLRAQSVSVLNTATLLPTTPLSRRLSLEIMNYGNEPVFVGNSSVTVAQGFPLMPRATLQLSMEEEVPVYAIAATGGVDVRVLEGA